MNALKLFVFFSVVMAGLAFADERTLTPEQMEALAKGGELDNPLSPPFHPPFTPLSPPFHPPFTPSTPVQGRLQGPPAKSKFLAVSQFLLDDARTLVLEYT